MRFLLRYIFKSWVFFPTLYFVLVYSFFEVRAQSVLREVYFPVKINTSSRNIDFQSKQTFALADMGIYASNEFQGARLNDFKKINDSTVAVFINPENEPINNSAYYAFLLWSKTKRHIYLNFKYPSEYKHRYRPKIKSVDGGWKKLSKKNIVKDGNEAIAKIQVDKTPILVSAQELSTSTDADKWINTLISGREDYVRLLSAGKSKFQRNIPVLDIYKGSKQGKPIVVLMTRQHPPEITGFFAYQFFLETILNESELSSTFLEKYRILAFPIVNPDGVDLGNWRHNGGGVDLNRDWSRYRQPEIRNVANFIVNSKYESDGKIVLGLDFHSTYKDIFYTNKTRKKTTMPNFIGDWFKALEENIPNYQVNERKSDSAAPNSKGWFLYMYNAVGITYEIGDSTPKKEIELIGKVSAREMMRILVENTEQGTK